MTDQKFINYYECGPCGIGWADIWSSQCDDDCPSCGRTYSPAQFHDVVPPENGRTPREYAVTLLYPDYLANEYGEETYAEIVRADDSDKAIKAVQQSAADANNESEEPQDFVPVSVVTVIGGALVFAF
jgi:hypothetical protein